MSNWSLLKKMTTELILETMVLMQDDLITCSNCMGTLYMLSSVEGICGKMRGLRGEETILNLLSRQFQEEDGRKISQTTQTQTNNHLRFTLRTLRHLTEPEVSKAYYSRISTGINLRAVLETLSGL